MTKEEHKQIHIDLHNSFDDLLADFIYHTGKLPTRTNLMEFMDWSYKQTLNPTEKKVIDGDDDDD